MLHNTPLRSVLCLILVTGLACTSPDAIRKQRFGVKKAPTSGKVSKPYTINGRKYYPLASAKGFAQTGIASWYGPNFHGKKAANGETYDQMKMTAAHKTLPFNTMVNVHSYDTGKNIVVRVNDRGPFVDDRVIDLSKKAASELGMLGNGTARVKLTVGRGGGSGRFFSGRGKVIEPLPPDREEGEFWVQVGSFSELENAKGFKDGLSSKHSGLRIHKKRFFTGKVYRVHIGPYSNRGDAERAARRTHIRGAFVVANP